MFKIPAHYIRYNDTDENMNTEYEATNDDMKFLSELQGSPFDIDEFEYIIAFWERKVSSGDMIPFEELFYLLLPKFHDKQNPALQIYNYWVGIRTTLKRPIMRKYWSKPDPTNTDHNVTFRPYTVQKPALRKFKKDEGENIAKLKLLSHQFKMSLDVVGKTIIREKAKKLLYDHDKLLFLQKKGEIIDPNYDINILQHHDNQIEQKHFFSEFAKIKKVKAEPKVIDNVVDKEPSIEYINNQVRCTFEIACYIVALSYKVDSLEVARTIYILKAQSHEAIQILNPLTPRKAKQSAHKQKKGIGVTK